MSHELKVTEYAEKNGIAWITLNRPQAYNAFTPDMNREIIASLKQADRSEDVRCILLKGAGKAFCAGEDLGGVDESTNHAEFLRERYHPMMKAMNQTEKPVVAAVHGNVAGAGMSLALAADFRLVQPETKFVSAFTGIGLVPDSGFLYYLPRLIGYAKALEIAVLGKPLTGKDALDMGLATELIEAQDWEKSVEEFCLRLAAMPTKAIGLIKRYMLEGMHESLEDFLDKEAQAQRVAGLSDDHREGLQSFKDKRKPVFTGK
ncbi:2-(1,2-epoxy-1,2-dihydrophenyl)acetyl-CoA isomerase [Salibacterium salarium]|uniref:2-(1,2-epoxy-1,2-dihydrophenyl)acetyl-CoA isomerase n=1 Tax=Salibacterium salarium TaxID=284579 RepID=A0A3R9P064_9BACI|nr:enoyl-CoA hydratase-related protein [Salibacterium salarium]RSL30014.1 2-(1,2-epoxy-1,2-dihydrophenyl)acetyl-CoA isomerase [Salibacterium salarium]